MFSAAELIPVSSGQSAADVNQRKTNHAAKLQFGDAHLRPHALLGHGIERHREQIAPRIERAPDYGGGYAQIAGFERPAIVVAGDGRFELRIPAEHQESALTSGHGQGRVYHRGQDLLGRERVLKSARDFHERTKLREIIGLQLAGLRARGKLIQNAVELAGLEREGELIGFADAQIDAVRTPEHMARDLLAIDPGPMAAVQVFDDVASVFGNDPRVAARGAVIAQHQMIVRMAADQKRERIQAHPGTLPGGFSTSSAAGRSPVRDAV